MNNKLTDERIEKMALETIDTISTHLVETTSEDGGSIEVNASLFLNLLREVQKCRKADNEPVMYQTRTRPTWNASQPWSLWSECSAESYKETMRFATEPDGAGWLYEGRILHTAQPVPVVPEE
ncbi:hypothetical protein KWJ46_004071 [Salmonella enterica subsp. enterica]|nr:hypothetical protein [Salmonella enterica subsp. enterica]EHS8059994.1 hypothetical protein [Salmonella enterica subsp. enterica]